MKALSCTFAALAILLSDVMCAVVAFNYCDMLWGIRYASYSAPASTAFLLVIPYAAAIAVCTALGDLRAGKALLGELRRRDDQKALAGAQILRIDHEDVLVLLRRGAGILIAAGEIRADGDLHHRVILVCVAREHLAVLVLADRRRAAKVSAAVHVGKNVGGRDVYTIVEVLAVLDDAQRRDGNIIALEQRGRQVARAVGNNLHSHRSFLPS